MIEDRRIDALFGTGSGEMYSTLPLPEDGEEYAWGAYPTDERRYEEFIQWVLSLGGREGAKPVFPGTGAPDETDVRQAVAFSNGIVDWTNADEETPLLQGELPGGWIDPDCLHVGGASRVRDDTRRVLGEVPAQVFLERRELSFITLDVPTWVEDRNRRSESLYERLIADLVDLKETERDTLYGWLEVVFRFCAGKPLVYYSRYVPGEQIRFIADLNGVRLTHVPLRALPEALLAANHAFRMMHLSLSQWDELEKRMTAAGMWPEVQILREHRKGN